MSVLHLKIYVRLPCQGIYSAGSVDIQPVCYEADMEDSDFVVGEVENCFVM
jgi:hypothetical protein